MTERDTAVIEAAVTREVIELGRLYVLTDAGKYADGTGHHLDVRPTMAWFELQAQLRVVLALHTGLGLHFTDEIAVMCAKAYNLMVQTRDAFLDWHDDGDVDATRETLSAELDELHRTIATLQ